MFSTHARSEATASKTSRDASPTVVSRPVRLKAAFGNQAMLRAMGRANVPISQPGDRSEREADAVADRVMTMQPHAVPEAAPAAARAEVRRTCSTCADEDREVRRAATGDAPTVAAAPAPSGGMPLPASERAFFEPRFGVDFSGVRIHTDSDADRSTRELGAAAWTYGNDIAFRAGTWSPGNGAGRRLLAHELAHVVQGQGHGIHRMADGTTLTRDGGGQVRPQLLPPERTLLCRLVCACDAAPGNMTKDGCVSASLTAASLALNNVSTLKAQVLYNMTTIPPSPMMDSSDPLANPPWPPGTIHHRIPNFTPGNPATGTYMVRRPDVVAVFDPTMPPVQANIRAIVEIKFPPDTWGVNQEADYQRIAGTSPVELMRPSDCNCPDTRGRRVRVPVRELTALLAAAAAAAAAAAGRQAGRRGGGRVLGPAYTAAVLIAAGVMLTSEDAHASLSLEGSDPIEALVTYLSSNGMGAPEELRDLLHNDPELRARVEAAARSGDRNEVARAFQRRANEVISQNLDQFSREELELLLTGARTSSAVTPDTSVTVETLRAQLEVLRRGGTTEGTQTPPPGAPPGTAATPPAAPQPTPPQPAASPPQPATPTPPQPAATAPQPAIPASPGQVPPQGAAGGTPPSAELRARLAANPAALALWDRLTARSADRGPSADDASLRLFLDTVGPLTDNERIQLEVWLRDLPAGTTVETIMSNIAERLREMRRPATPQAPSSEPTEDPQVVIDRILTRLRAHTWRSEPWQFMWRSDFEPAEGARVQGWAFENVRPRKAAQVTLEFHRAGSGWRFTIVQCSIVVDVNGNTYPPSYFMGRLGQPVQ